MRPILFFTTLLFSKLSFSQNLKDTTIKKSQLDSIENVVYKLKDSSRRSEYERYVLQNYHSIDSNSYSKNSKVIKYKSKSGRLLKTHTKENYQSDGLYGYEQIEYLNSIERPEFVQRWDLARSLDDETGRVLFIWKVYSYERFLYDSKERVITSIKFYPAFSRRRVRKYEHTYHSDGTETITRQSIEIEKFWE
jgi:hypothetical protein